MSQEQLKKLRMAIAEGDRAIIEIIANRIAIVENIAAIKKACDLPVEDPIVEKEILAVNKKTAIDSGVPEDLIEKITQLLIANAREQQSKL